MNYSSEGWLRELYRFCSRRIRTRRADLREFSALDVEMRIPENRCDNCRSLSWRDSARLGHGVGALELAGIGGERAECPNADKYVDLEKELRLAPLFLSFHLRHHYSILEAHTGTKCCRILPPNPSPAFEARSVSGHGATRTTGPGLFRSQSRHEG